MAKKGKSIVALHDADIQPHKISQELNDSESDPVSQHVRPLSQPMQSELDAVMPLSYRLSLAAKNAKGEAQGLLNGVLVELQMARHKASVAAKSEHLFSSDELMLLQEISEL